MRLPRSLRLLLHAHETKFRFLAAGALNTLFGLGFYPLAYLLLAPLREHYILLLAIAQAPCVTFSFLTNKFLVFRTKGNIAREYLKFASYYSSLFALNLAALPALVELLRIHPVIAQTLFTVITIAVSYLWHSRITFSATHGRHDA